MTWISALLRRTTAQVAGTAAGVALAVGLFASVGAFVAHAKATMTEHAVAGTTLDWQVEAKPGTNVRALRATVARSPGVVAALPVGYARVPALTATTGGSTQTTGAAVVLGVPPGYERTFPEVTRRLAGTDGGVRLAQQTAANLHAAPGDTVEIARPGAKPVAVRVAGVTDVVRADALFQLVGPPPGAQPTAPPDNVVLLPLRVWHAAFDGIARTHPATVRAQLHVRRDHTYPHDPASAYSRALGEAKHLELALAGRGRVADNVGANLASAREDALYAEALFLALALPGIACAALLTTTVAAAARERRRREQALLRARGASVHHLVGFAALEALTVATIGGAAGLALAALLGHAFFGSASFGATASSAVGFAVAALLLGLVVAMLSIALPAIRDARALSVARARQAIGGARIGTVVRLGTGVVLLLAGGVIFWATSRTGYQLVLAPEGVATISVSYWALAGPALVWIGGTLLAWSLTDGALRRGRPALARLAVPVAGPLAGAVGATLQRERRGIVRSVVLITMTIAFAGSTAVFNATYRHQARVDALLTNGADVTVTVPPGADRPTLGARLAALPAVRHVEPLQHRFAYVGSDLQDLYGVDPATVVRATKLQDAYFAGGSAHSLIAALASRSDAVLVSAETVHDFQLHPGDRLNLRLMDARTKSYRTVTFHYAGVAKEFPTAPSDSFLVANRAYVSAMTHDRSVGAYLLDTGGAHHRQVRRRAQALVGPYASVTDIDHVRRLVASSLTAVDLSGLTKIELTYALALAAAATGLALWLGFVERRRSYAIAMALGARRRQVGAFVWSESALVGAVGVVIGVVGAFVITHMLVKVLTGVFDPAPSALAVPWRYLGVVVALAVAATVVAAWAAVRRAAHAGVDVLREP